MKRSVTPLLLCIVLFTGCHHGTPVDKVDHPVVQQLTVNNIGACQGVFIWEGSVWLYGDRDGEGIIKRLEWVGPNDNAAPMLVDTGETYELKLYRNRYARNDDNEQLPRNLIPNPSGITYHPDYDTFIANTDDEQSTLYPIHFLGLTESGSLDDWIMNKVIDDLATNGTRPEFIRYNGRWLIASADGLGMLRLYDPAKLKKAKRTSDDGVLVQSFSTVPFVQSLHWIDEEQTLVLAQNQTANLGYRLTLLKFDDDPKAETFERVIDLGQPADKLTGFGIIAPGWAVLSSASEENNVSIIRWPID
jgi:hypothetical protein